MVCGSQLAQNTKAMMAALGIVYYAIKQAEYPG
jgi:hypothetical protein